MAKSHMRTPCENCPYRLDAPREYWSVEEFESVLDGEAWPLGKVFACHKQGALPNDERGLCAGWLLDQKKRGVPSIALRVMLSAEPDALAAYESVSDGGTALFEDVAAMCTANGVPAEMVPRFKHDQQPIARRKS